MFKKLLILVLLITPVSAYTPEFCSPLLEGECTDYQEDVVSYFITDKIKGRYVIKVFPKDKRMPIVTIPYPNQDSMYKDFYHNWEVYMSEMQEKHKDFWGWKYIDANFDKALGK